MLHATRTSFEIAARWLPENSFDGVNIGSDNSFVPSFPM